MRLCLSSQEGYLFDAPEGPSILPVPQKLLSEVALTCLSLSWILGV